MMIAQVIITKVTILIICAEVIEPAIPNMKKKMKTSMSMNTPKKISQIIEVLTELYPDAICSLNYATAFQLLISVILSAQTTDSRVNTVTPILFSKYPNPAQLSKAKVGDVEEILHPLGFFRSKAQNIITCSKQLVEKFNSQVPDNMEDLTSLAGVGRKTANLILGDVFGQPSYVCDTHAIRISNRLGFTNSTNPDKAETDLRKIIPPEGSSFFFHRLVLFGRETCSARSPKCEQCKLRTEHLCNYKN